MFFPTLAIVLIAALVAGAFQMGKLTERLAGVKNTKTELKTQPTPQKASKIEPISDKDHIRGSKDAEIALIEYSDLECPFCKQFHKTAQQVVDGYNGKVMWVYRHFPIDNLHPKADKEAEAAECAAKLGKDDAFWAFVDKIFEITPSNNGLELGELPNIAEEIGLNRQAFEQCLNSGEMARHVEQDYQTGITAGVTGTPGNLILNVKTGKSVLLPGALPLTQIEQAIDQLL